MIATTRAASIDSFLNAEIIHALCNTSVVKRRKDGWQPIDDVRYLEDLSECIASDNVNDIMQINLGGHLPSSGKPL